MALGLDGHANGAASALSVTATLTTVNAGDFIVAQTTSFTNGIHAGMGAVTGGGLTWALRTRQQITATVASDPLAYDEWVAYAPAALTSQVITATQGSGGGVNYLTLEVYGVTGVDTDLVFDQNASLPAISSFAAGGNANHTVSGISTTAAATFEMGVLATTAGGSGGAAADAGFTLIDNVWNNTSYGGLQTEYKVNASQLSGVSQNIFASLSSITTNYHAVVDALVAAGSARSGPKAVNFGAPTTGSLVTTLTPALPPSRVNGNLLLAQININNGTETVAWPGGWTVIENWNTSNQTGSKAYRFVDGTETAPVLTWANAAYCQAEITQISGAKNPNPIGASSHAGAQGTSVSCPTITTTGANSLVINRSSTGETMPLWLPTPWRPRMSGGNSNFAWHIADQYIPTSGTASASTASTLYANDYYTNMTTEILAPASAATTNPAIIFVGA